MDKGLIPRRYAKALYQVGMERKDNETLYGLMQTLAASFAAEPALVRTLANPFVAVSDKTSLLVSAAGGDSAAADITFADFLKLLVENGRLDIAWDIARAFIDLYRERHSIYRVVVTSAATLGKAECSRIEALVAGHIGQGTIEYDYKVDPSLIGGFTIAVNSQLLDASVASRLQQLRQHLVF